MGYLAYWGAKNSGRREIKEWQIARRRDTPRFQPVSAPKGRSASIAGMGCAAG